MRVVVEGAGDQHVEPRLGGFARGGDEVDAGERAELRADQDAGAALGLAFQEAAFGADIFAGPGLQAGEVDAVGLLASGARRRCADGPAPSRRNRPAASRLCRRWPGADGWVEQFVLVGGHDAVRRQALDGERAGDADARLVLVGAVVEEFDVGAACDRGVDLLLPLDAGFPPGARAVLA